MFVRAREKRMSEQWSERGSACEWEYPKLNTGSVSSSVPIVLIKCQVPYTVHNTHTPQKKCTHCVYVPHM